MLGVPSLTLCALLGAAIERGEHHRTVLERLAGGRLEEIAPPRFSSDDLYPDARPALDALRGRGLSVAIAGNFSRSVADDVRSWGVPADVVTSAEELGAEKPDPAFFTSLAAALEVEPPELLYVGDRLDNDVVAARAAGCRSVFLRRGPWALIQERTTPPPDGGTIQDLAALARFV